MEPASKWKAREKRKRENSSDPGQISESDDAQESDEGDSKDPAWVAWLKEWQHPHRIRGDTSSSNSGQQITKEIMKLSLESKKQLRKELDLEGKIRDVRLDDTHWEFWMLAATHAKLRDLAHKMRINADGDKSVILTRIVEWYKETYFALEHGSGLEI